jgi:hypothetical protein
MVQEVWIVFQEEDEGSDRVVLVFADQALAEEHATALGPGYTTRNWPVETRLPQMFAVYRRECRVKEDGSVWDERIYNNFAWDYEERARPLMYARSWNEHIYVGGTDPRKVDAAYEKKVAWLTGKRKQGAAI